MALGRGDVPAVAPAQFGDGLMHVEMIGEDPEALEFALHVYAIARRDAGA